MYLYYSWVVGEGISVELVEGMLRMKIDKAWSLKKKINISRLSWEMVQKVRCLPCMHITLIWSLALCGSLKPTEPEKALELGVPKNK